MIVLHGEILQLLQVVESVSVQGCDVIVTEAQVLEPSQTTQSFHFGDAVILQGELFQILAIFQALRLGKMEARVQL